MPRRNADRTKSATTQRIDAAIAAVDENGNRKYGEYPDLADSEKQQLMSHSDSWGRENPDPPQELQDKINARAKAIREWHRETDEYRDEPVEIRCIPSAVFNREVTE